jgi:hypothetical protein
MDASIKVILVVGRNSVTTICRSSKTITPTAKLIEKAVGDREKDGHGRGYILI